MNLRQTFLFAPSQDFSAIAAMMAGVTAIGILKQNGFFGGKSLYAEKIALRLGAMV